MGKRRDLYEQKLKEGMEKREKELRNKYEGKKIIMPNGETFDMYVKSDFLICIDVTLCVDDYEYVRYDYHSRLRNGHIGLSDKYGTITFGVFGSQKMNVEEVLKDKYCSTMYFVKKHMRLMSKGFDRSMIRPS